ASDQMGGGGVAGPIGNRQQGAGPIDFSGRGALGGTEGGERLSVWRGARARSTSAAGALWERLRRVSSVRSAGVSGRNGSFWWRDMGHLAARGSPHHYTRSDG